MPCWGGALRPRPFPRPGDVFLEGRAQLSHTHIVTSKRLVGALALLLVWGVASVACSQGTAHPAPLGDCTPSATTVCGPIKGGYDGGSIEPDGAASADAGSDAGNDGPVE